MISETRYYLCTAIVFAAPVAMYLVLILAPFFTTDNAEISGLSAASPGCRNPEQGEN